MKKQYFTLTDKISEIKTFAEVGLLDVKHTGLNVLNGLIGLKKGYPFFVGGAPGSGKTEFVFEILMNTSILYGWKHFIYCGEGGNVEHVFNELVHKYLQKPYKWADEKDKLHAEYFVNEHFIIANHDHDFTVDEFYLMVEDCEKQMEIKFDTTTFDPFNDIKDETEKFGGREDKYLADALKKVRVISKEKNRIDIIVTHIADVRRYTDKEGNSFLPAANANEWAGGRTWWRRAFTMVLVYRPPMNQKDSQGMPYAENESHIIIQKTKPKGVGKIGKASIFWDWKKNRYYCYEGSQQLYSCEKIEDYLMSNLKPNVDFTQSINKLNDEQQIF